jgi:hypothetical protein
MQPHVSRPLHPAVAPGKAQVKRDKEGVGGRDEERGYHRNSKKNPGFVGLAAPLLVCLVAPRQAFPCLFLIGLVTLLSACLQPPHPPPFLVSAAPCVAPPWSALTLCRVLRAQVAAAGAGVRIVTLCQGQCG